MTRRQAQLLAFLRAEAVEGRCPTFDEMRAHLGLLSKSSAHRLIEALEERGKIRRLYNRVRAIEVLDWSSPQSLPSSVPAYSWSDVAVLRLRGRIE